MAIKTDYLESCMNTMKMSLKFYHQEPVGGDVHLLAACTLAKNYELSLELAGKLLRKALSTYHSNAQATRELTYKEVLREAAKYRLIDVDAVERWFEYRDYRNTLAHDYGLLIVEEIPDFIEAYLDDLQNLIIAINAVKG